MDKLETLQHYIDMDYIPKSWSLCYQDALNTFKKNWFLDFDFKSICSFYNLPNDFIISLLETIDLLKNDDNLNFLCYFFYYILYFSNESHDIWSWDSKNVFTNHGNHMIPTISLLAGQPIHMENMQKRNYDKYQIDKHKQNLYSKILNDYYSIIGLSFRHMVWLSIFIKCDIIEIGRLQYDYRSSVDMDCLNDKKYHIKLHIPSGNPLNIQDIKLSLADAKKYIYSYFDLEPNRELEYYCESWLFSPELKYFLNEDSNILSFQRLFNIVKYRENLKDFMLFVFNLHDTPKDFSILKSDTSLQKNMKNYLLEGKKLHIGTAILKNEVI